MQQIQAVRDRFAHELPVGATLVELVRFMAKKTLLSAPEKRGVRKQVSKEQENVTTLPVSGAGSTNSFRNAREKPGSPSGLTRAPKSGSRYIPVKVKRLVWERDQGRCQFVSPTTDKKCLSPHRAQSDHIVPFALGGSSIDPNGLRLLCFTHNQWEARRVFGEVKVSPATNAHAVAIVAPPSSRRSWSPDLAGPPK